MIYTQGWKRPRNLASDQAERFQTVLGYVPGLTVPQTFCYFTAPLRRQGIRDSVYGQAAAAGSKITETHD
jgi:hypothetical protein